jgi:hypothetical protein
MLWIWEVTALEILGALLFSRENKIQPSSMGHCTYMITSYFCFLEPSPWMHYTDYIALKLIVEDLSSPFPTLPLPPPLFLSITLQTMKYISRSVEWNLMWFAVCWKSPVMSLLFFEHPTCIELIKWVIPHCRNRIEQNRIHREVGVAGCIVVNSALQMLSIFCTALSHSAAHTLNRVQYPADGDIMKVTRFHKMFTQVPKSYCGLCLAVTENLWGHCICLLASTTPGISYQFQSK